MSRRLAVSGLAAPHIVVVLLLVANVVIYLLCLDIGHTVAIPPSLLEAAGALTPGALRPNLATAPQAAAVLVGALTLLVLSGPLRRGLGDVGFIAATFMGNRRREHGLVRPTHHTRT